MKTCPKCGYKEVKLKPGRPRTIDPEAAKVWRKEGFSLREIAEAFGVTHGAVQQALKKYSPTKRKHG